MHLILSLLLPVAAIASAVGNIVPRADSCAQVTSRVRANNERVLATSYCKSVLTITQSTSSVIVSTTKRVGRPTSTITSGTTTVIEKTTTATPSTIYVFPTDYSCLGGGLTKRAVNKPSAFSLYTRPAQITSACNCLSIAAPAPTTTTSTTTISRQDATSTITVTTFAATTTSTSTQTVASVVTSTGTYFQMNQQGQEDTYARTYQVTLADGSNQEVLQFAWESERGNVYILEADCALKASNAFTDGSNGVPDPVYFQPGEPVQEIGGTGASDYARVYCTVDRNTNILSCGSSTTSSQPDYACGTSFASGGYCCLWFLGGCNPNSFSSNGFTNQAVVVG